MKKKIFILSFLLLVLITAILFAVAIVHSYNYDMDPANGVDIFKGLHASILFVLAWLVILCELDLFFTVYYFVIKPKTLPRSICMIMSHLMLLMVIFSENLAKFLSLHVSDIFKEEINAVAPIFFFYVILRITCIMICFSKKE